MAKNNIRDWSTTASNNSDIAGIGILGTNAVSNFDGGLRELMKQVADVDEGVEPMNDTFTLCDPADTTKRFRLDGGSVTTGNTRVLTVPDTSTILVGTDATQTLTNKTLTDSGTEFADEGDSTKRAKFDCAGITTATTRTYTLPNASSTLAVLGLAQTWSAAQTFTATVAISSAPLSMESASATTAANRGVRFKVDGTEYGSVYYDNTRMLFNTSGSDFLFNKAVIANEQAVKSSVSNAAAASARGFRQLIDGVEQLALYHDNTSGILQVGGTTRLTVSATTATFAVIPILPSYTVATLPSAASSTRGIVFVSDGTANKRLAVSDGTNWRFPDGNIVS